MRRLLLFCALAWPCGYANAAACGTAGLLINGFNSAGACTPTTETLSFTSTQPLSSVATGAIPGVSANIEGGEYGRVAYNATFTRMTLTAAAVSAATGSVDLSTGHDFLFYAYASTYTAGNQFNGEYYIQNGASNLVYVGTGGNITRSAYASTTDWSLLILSLNYAKNLGFTPDNVSTLAVQQRSTVGAFSVAFCFDDLTLQDGGDTPNTPLTNSDVTGVASCSPHNITFNAQSQTGTDPITGYHVYRSTNGPAGPYISYKYVAQSATPFFTESGPSFYNNVYYKILPYSNSTTAFLGGVFGRFTKGGNAGIDPQNASANGGVHEDLLTNATAIGPFDQASACSPTFSPTYSFTPTLTATATQSPTSSATSTDSPTSTASPTATQTSTATPTSTMTPTATPSASASATSTLTMTGLPTSTFTSTSTPTPSQSFTASPLATSTYTSTITVSPTQSFSQTSTLLPSGTFTITLTVSPTPTISSSFTPSPLVTPTLNPNSGAQLYPNPFHPDKGETFHLGNVPAGLRVNIYNIIGEFVIGFTTKGNPTEDHWDSLNANGVKVVTGIYFLQIDGNIYRVAVVRD